MRPSADQLFDTIKPFLRPLVPSPRLKQPRAYRVIKRTKRPARLVVEKKKPLTYVRQLLRESRERIKDEAILLKWIEKGDRAWHDWDFQLLPATPATPQSEQAEAKAEEASTVAEAQPVSLILFVALPSSFNSVTKDSTWYSVQSGLTNFYL